MLMLFHGCLYFTVFISLYFTVFIILQTTLRDPAEGPIEWFRNISISNFSLKVVCKITSCMNIHGFILTMPKHYVTLAVPC